MTDINRESAIFNLLFDKLFLVQTEKDVDKVFSKIRQTFQRSTLLETIGRQ